MNITIINDCQDANAVGRQTTRAAALFGGAVSFIGVGFGNDLEAAGNLIDTLDALEENPGVVLVNVAPRNGRSKTWENGTPFGYFSYKKILVVASVEGHTLSLIKKLRLIETLTVLDLPRALDQLTAGGLVPIELKDRITKTQFRSYEFVPRAAAFLAQGHDLQGERLSIEDILEAPRAVWWVDNFGNCKTTLLEEDLEDQDGFAAPFARMPYFPRLKDVSDKTPAFVTGSSGLGDKRFLEVVVQGTSASQELSISSGTPIV